MGRQGRERTKACARCAQTAEVLYRVVVATDGDWIFVCRDCWDAVAIDNPAYRYGGTWKARKQS